MRIEAGANLNGTRISVSTHARQRSCGGFQGFVHVVTVGEEKLDERDFICKRWRATELEAFTDALTLCGGLFPTN
jgi:hypothetical protein